VVEVYVLFEPLHSLPLHVSVDECLIDGVNIFHSTLRLNKLFCSPKHREERLVDSKRKPGAFDLWVDRVGDIKVLVNLHQYYEGSQLTLHQSFYEYHFHTAIIFMELPKKQGRILSFSFDVVFSKFLRTYLSFSCEIQIYRSKSWLVDPSIPVHFTLDSGRVLEVLVNKIFKHLFEHFISD
jgi:hypothetical protein